MPGVTVKDVNQQEFVRALAAFLKKSGKLKVPDWVDLVKLAKHKELGPSDDNWFYVRAASTVRHLYLRGGAGVGSMTKIYGGRKRNGVCPAHFSVGSKNVARKVLQALELLKMVEKDPNGGRRVTSQGTRDLDRIAGQWHYLTAAARTKACPCTVTATPHADQRRLTSLVARHKEEEDKRRKEEKRKKRNTAHDLASQSNGHDDITSLADEGSAPFVSHSSVVSGVFLLCSGAVTVTVSPMVEVLNGAEAILPCTYTAPTSTNVIVEWFVEVGQGVRKRVAYHSQSGSGTDEGTAMSGRVTMGQDFSLTLKPIQPIDQLTLLCQVTAGPAGMGEATTMLKVFHAPEKPELTRPSSQAITVGEGTSSEIGTCVTKNGHPVPRIIWFMDDQPLAEVKDRNEKTYMTSSLVKEASQLLTVKSTLFMQPTKKDKDAVFQCTVEYSMPKQKIEKMTSDPITINLNYPSETATFTLMNKAPVKEGDMVTMKCETDGNPQPEFDFTKDGEMTAGQGGILTLKSVNRSDAGLYKCKATDFDNLEANLNGEINLAVSYIDPVSVTPAGPLLVKLDEMVEVQCKTKSSGLHTIQWKKGSEVLSQSGMLSIQKVSYDNAGKYMCVGAVPTVPGLTTMGSVEIIVKGSPKIVTPVNGLVTKQGEMVTLKCSAYGHPVPQFTWKPSGKESVTLEGNMAVSNLTLEATAEVMKDGVTCEVSNEYGKDSKLFSVSIGGREVWSDKQQGGSSMVVIAVVVCVLLLLLFVALIYFLNKKGKLPCGAKTTKDVSTREANNDIVVEMKTEKANEEDGLLNKRPATEQVRQSDWLTD
ncbi:unnamed protein product [Merluccius merluccius]